MSEQLPKSSGGESNRAARSGAAGAPGIPERGTQPTSQPPRGNRESRFFNGVVPGETRRDHDGKQLSINVPSPSGETPVTPQPAPSDKPKEPTTAHSGSDKSSEEGGKRLHNLPQEIKFQPQVVLAISHLHQTVLQHRVMLEYPMNQKVKEKSTVGNKMERQQTTLLSQHSEY